MVGDFFGFTAVNLVMYDISIGMFEQMKKLLSFGENINIIKTTRKDIKYIMDITNPKDNIVFFYVNTENIEDKNVNIDIAEYNRLYNRNKRRVNDYGSIYDVINFVYDNVKDKSSNKYVSYFVISGKCEMDKCSSLSLPSKQILSKLCSESSHRLLEAYYNSTKDVDNKITKNAFIEIFGIPGEAITKCKNEYSILYALNEFDKNKHSLNQTIEDLKTLESFRTSTPNKIKDFESIAKLKNSVKNSINNLIISDDNINEKIKIMNELNDIGVYGYNPFFNKLYKRFYETVVISLPQEPSIKEDSVCSRFLDKALMVLEAYNRLIRR